MTAIGRVSGFGEAGRGNLGASAIDDPQSALFTGQPAYRGASGPRVAIRKHCLDCCETTTEVANCPKGPKSGDECSLWFCRRGPTVKKERAGSALKAIRARCLDCMNGSGHMVRVCPTEECSLWPFRFGRKPKGNAGVSLAKGTDL